jgi:Trypsin-like peptidase domain
MSICFALFGTIIPNAQSQMPATPIQLAAVFGEDTRKHLQNSATKLDLSTLEAARRVGIIRQNPGSPRCTAVCIQPNMVLTAAHCLPHPSQERGSEPKFAFWPHLGQQSAKIVGRLGPEGAMRTAPPITAHTDWAMLRLSESVCPKVNYETPVTPFKDLQLGLDHVYQLGFHRDYGQGQRLTKSGNCTLRTGTLLRLQELAARDFTNPDAILFHHCDNAALSSGAPLFRNGPKGPELIAINIGTYVQKRTVVPQQAGAWRTQEEAVANTAIPMAVIRKHLKSQRNDERYEFRQP